MRVKQEIKSQLAKLLATEDLVVEHKNVETAQFDVRTRVLTLPRWEKASNNVYDALVSHEVGHALYTPDRDWSLEVKVPQTFVNIVEDVRIEKLMKRRYAGIAKTFYKGYNELNDQDFFDIDGEDLTTFNLADRVNLYNKVGSWVDISFSPSEAQIVNLIDKAETFDDTLKAAIALYEYCKEEQKQNTEQVAINSKDGDLDLDIDSEQESEKEEADLDYQASGQEEGESEGGQKSSQPTNQGGEFGSDEPEIKTADALEDALKDLTDTSNKHEKVYVELPKLNLKNIIIPNEQIYEGIRSHWNDESERWKTSEYTTLSEDLFQGVDEEFIKFKRSAQKEVNYLVKEFECKKSASAYARATTSKTGVLDTTKLHTYKFNEDLFKKVTVIPDGKNHGLVFILDWSGSMAPVMQDTIKQLYNLLWFCKKVNIPFEVYAFTQCYPPHGDSIRLPAYEKEEGVALVEDTFSLMNLFSSKVRSKDLDGQMKDIFRLGYGFNRNNNWVGYSCPLGMNLSGTPLNETLISLHQLIPQFKTQYNLEKVQCVILTDGEGSPLRYSKNFENRGYMGSNYVSERCIIRNRKTGHTYTCEGLGHWADVSDLLIKDLRQTYLDTNFIGIRILNKRDAGQFIRRYTEEESKEYGIVMNRWRKEKSFAIKNSGYHTYFGLLSTALSNEDEFEVEEDATKAQIKRAFVKSLQCKKMNKKVLGEFIELVA